MPPTTEPEQATPGAGPVTYRVDDGIAWVTIDRPEARNALDAATRRGLWAATRRFVADDQALVLVLTGTGEQAFCAGADLKEMAGTALEVPPPDFLPQFGRNVDVPKLTIAAVNGGPRRGFLLAQMCDLCIAAEGATFAIAEARVGRGAPGPPPCLWLIPPPGGPGAVAHGVAHRCPAGADHRAGQRGRGPGRSAPTGPGDRPDHRRQRPLSVRAAKAMVYAATERHRADAFEEAERIWAPVYRSRDAQEGPQAFREKRAPNWLGR